MKASRSGEDTNAVRHIVAMFEKCWPLAILICLPGVCAYGEVCNPADLVGPFAFQLTGTTTIAGGTPKPTASLGRIVLDGRGNLSGTASAMFEGLLLGNPVTGTYEAHSDCAVSWKMQDDSGAFQSFNGTLSSDGTRVQFKQTDPDGPSRGIMQKVSTACTAADLQQKYSFTMLGKIIPMQEGGVSKSITMAGALEVDPSGSVRLTTPEGAMTTGTLQIDSDCTIHLNLILPASGNGTETPAKLRGALVSEGKEILAIQTDPGAMVSARFSSESK